LTTSNVAWWFQQLRMLMQRISPSLRFLRQQPWPLYHIFQVYVYALVVYAAMKAGCGISPQQIRSLGNDKYFICKLNPRAYYSGSHTYSYFKITKNGRDFFLALNLDVSIVGYKSIVLNLDVVATKYAPKNINKRDNVMFFIECKSVNYASPEYVATVLGQSFLVKRGQHPYVGIEDLLAVRGKATYSSKELCKLTSRWKRSVKIVDCINPKSEGERKLLQEVMNLLGKI